MGNWNGIMKVSKVFRGILGVLQGLFRVVSEGFQELFNLSGRAPVCYQNSTALALYTTGKVFW